MKKQYYSMEKVENEAYINIYGDITSWAYEPVGEFSAVTLSNKLAELGDVSKINVCINSYGGEVAEGLAIYNALKRHKAKVVTYCDGFAASIASVIFMAGDERIMSESSLLMIHNAWTMAMGNADQLRKQAEDLEKITQASVTAYKAHSSLTEEEIKALMDNETWILPEEALEYGFATSIEKTEKKAASQNAKMRLIDIVKMYRQETEEQEADKDEEENTEDAEKTATDGGEGEGEETPADDNEKPAEEEKPAVDPEEPPADDADENKEEEAVQKLHGFFNAILKM